MDGINVDIENVTLPDRDNYTKLVKLLRQKLPKEKAVVVSVAANPYGYETGWHASYDYEKLGQYADYLMIMAYDEHYEGGTAGPVASTEFVEASIKYALKYVSKDKVVLGIPFYGRYWSKSSGVGGKAISLTQIDELKEKYEIVEKYDEKSKSPYLILNVKKGDNIKIGSENLSEGEYEIWFENEESILNKLEIMKKYQIKGIGTWKLGLENTNIWQKIKYAMQENRTKKVYSDLTKSHWAYSYIEELTNLGIVEGYSNGEFRPDEYITRAEVTKIVSEILKSK